MKRNILLFVCVCLAAAAGLLVIHFHQRAAAPVASSNRAPVQPAKPLPVTASAPAGPVVKTPVAQTEQNSAALAVVETNASETPAAEEKNTAESDKYEALRELTQWAARDPEGALDAIMKMPEGSDRNDALAAVCFGVAQTDPAAAVRIAQDLQLDQQQQPTAVMEDLVQQWANMDVVSSLAWTENQPPGASRDEYTTRIAFILSQSDPSDAATLVIDQIPPGSARDEAIMTVIHQWGNQDMVAAAAWAHAVVTGPLQERVINELNGILDYQQALAQSH